MRPSRIHGGGDKVAAGKVLNVGSTMSIFGAPFAAPYGASKGGIVQLTRGPRLRMGEGQHPVFL